MAARSISFLSVELAGRGRPVEGTPASDATRRFGGTVRLPTRQGCSIRAGGGLRRRAKKFRSDHRLLRALETANANRHAILSFATSPNMRSA